MKLRTGASYSLILVSLVFSSCSSFCSSFPDSNSCQSSTPSFAQVSFYADSLHGNPTASGALYDKENFSAAHRTLPFGTQVLLQHPRNSKQVTVCINDRGPFVDGREFDLSKAAAKELGILRQGVAQVSYQILQSKCSTRSQ